MPLAYFDLSSDPERIRPDVCNRGQAIPGQFVLECGATSVTQKDIAEGRISSSGLSTIVQQKVRIRDSPGPAGHVQVNTQFFFFQAEDGIRDLYVTGVQTCALPI